MESYKMIIFTKKTGKMVKAIESGSKAMLSLYALQNLTKTRAAIIIDESGEVIDCYVGNESGFPKKMDSDYCKAIKITVG